MVAQKEIELVYGRDVFADDDISLLILDQKETRLLRQMQHAKTWGEALEGHPEILRDLSLERDEMGEEPLNLSGSFTFTDEAGPDRLTYRIAIYAESHATSILRKINLKPHADRLRFEQGMIDCDRSFLKDDDTAELVLEKLKEGFGDGNVNLVRDDSEVSWFQEGLFQ